MTRARQDMIDEIVSLTRSDGGGAGQVRELYDAFTDEKLREVVESLRHGKEWGERLARETAPARKAIEGKLAELAVERASLVQDLLSIGREQVPVRQEKRIIHETADHHADWSRVVASSVKSAGFKKAVRDLHHLAVVGAPGAGKTSYISYALKHVQQFIEPAAKLKALNEAYHLAKPLAFGDASEKFVCDFLNSLGGDGKWRRPVSQGADHGYDLRIDFRNSSLIVEFKQLATELMLRVGSAHDMGSLSAEERISIALDLPAFPFVSPYMRAEAVSHPLAIHSPSERIKAFAKLAIATEAAEPAVLGYFDGRSRVLAELLMRSTGRDPACIVDFTKGGVRGRLDACAAKTGAAKPVVLLISYFCENESRLEDALARAEADAPGADIRALSLAVHEPPRALRERHYAALVSDEPIEDLWSGGARCRDEGDRFAIVGRNHRTEMSIAADDLFLEVKTGLEMEADFQRLLVMNVVNRGG